MITYEDFNNFMFNLQVNCCVDRNDRVTRIFDTKNYLMSSQLPKSLEGITLRSLQVNIAQRQLFPDEN